ncbi:MAG: hypothetical protein NTY41_18160 [Proteobacteria bacterium]|nr:hypothetical protein [Pseudomonadota bacterium]
MFVANTHRDHLRRLFMVISVFLSWLVVAVPNAQAVPSMARQTGQACTTCHTVFPELTPYGRQFKLGAFAQSSDKWDQQPLAQRLPLSGALQVSRTNTSDTNAGGTMPTDFPHDNKVIAQTVAIYYGGKIADNAGALIQYNYDGIEKKWGMEMFDARYARSVKLADKELMYGVTLNNSPTVSDIYNSTPSWSFPHTGTAAKQMPAASIVDMTLASKVSGIGAYGMWDDLVYVEVANYRTAKTGAFRFVGWGQQWNSDELAGSVVNGNAPYWRLALQKESGPHSFAVGTYGMTAKLWQDVNDRSLGTNRYRDVAYDANYQYIEGDHSASVRVTWIKEKQDWNAAVVNGGLVSNSNDTLKTFRADAHYFFHNQWGGILQYFKTTGSTDDLRYNTGDALMGSTNGNPNTKGWIAELNYLPLQNIKLALRYTRYQQFNGASTNYTPGRNASDNDNIFLMGWFMF